MSDDYLWDRSGPPDPEIERLERKLAPLRYHHGADLAGARPSRPRAWLAVAAAVLLAAFALWQLRAPASGSRTAWQVAGVEGAAHVGSRAAEVSMTLAAGEVVRTAAGSRLALEASQLGRIDIGPDSELRAATDRKVTLNRGLLHAFIWAPPREFVVDTPSARAVDLGCEYTLEVDRNGDGLLRVSLGWVAFQFSGNESFIPAGAECVTRKRQGPGIPYYEDAPEALRNALRKYERGDTAALEGILHAARPRDGLTLWHLLTRVPEARRPEVFDRFAQLVPLSAAISREQVLSGNPRAIDLCWDALNLENTGWWRGWERKW
jgi:hypothetical protein